MILFVQQGSGYRLNHRCLLPRTGIQFLATKNLEFDASSSDTYSKGLHIDQIKGA